MIQERVFVYIKEIPIIATVEKELENSKIDGAERLLVNMRGGKQVVVYRDQDGKFKRRDIKSFLDSKYA